MTPYTIIGYYDDEGKGFCDHVMAEDSNDSIRQWCKLHEPKCDDAEARKFWRENVTIVDILLGHCMSTYDSQHISSATDWPGCEDGKEIE